jgi:hypothetical protein
MNDVNREELNAKLSAVEARMDRRVASFHSEMRHAVADFKTDMLRFQHETTLQLHPLRGLKANVWSAAAFIAATVVGIAAMCFTVFDSGRVTGTLVQETKQQVSEIRALSKHVEDQVKAIRTLQQSGEGQRSN